MGDTMNGAGMLKIPGQAANPLVAALETVLAKAKAGEITTMAVIAMSPTGYFPPIMLGPQRSDLSVAIDFAKASLLADIFSPPKPGIVRAPAGLDVKGG